jgi:hypothetical protein
MIEVIITFIIEIVIAMVDLYCNGDEPSRDSGE